MISFLIGFMIMPALVGIILVITWGVEYFKYLASLLKAHYASRYAKKQAKKAEKQVIETVTENNANTEETPVADEIAQG